MRPAVAAWGLLALLAQNRTASADDLTLVLPHPLRAGESAWIEVQVPDRPRPGDRCHDRIGPGARRHFALWRPRRTGRRNLYAAGAAGRDPRRPRLGAADDYPVRCAAAPAHRAGSAQCQAERRRHVAMRRRWTATRHGRAAMAQAISGNCKFPQSRHAESGAPRSRRGGSDGRQDGQSAGPARTRWRTTSSSRWSSTAPSRAATPSRSPRI
jgi:hypothetical protein